MRWYAGSRNKLENHAETDRTPSEIRTGGNGSESRTIPFGPGLSWIDQVVAFVDTYPFRKYTDRN